MIGDALKITLVIVGLILVLIILSWALFGNEFFLYKFFAPKQENVRREVFENTKSYNQGMQQELENMQFEYYKATETQKDGLASVILNRVADYDEKKLKPDMQKFIKELRDRRGFPTEKKY